MNAESAYARAYARALYGSAQARHEADGVTQDVLALDRQWKGSPELRQFCRSHLPGSPADRARAVEKLWGDTFTRTMIFFLSVLAQRDHLGLVPLIAGQYQKMDDRAQGRSDVRISFACEPGEEEIGQIRKLVADAYGPVMKVAVRVDPALIAGARFFVNDRRVDASLAGRLARLRVGLSKPLQPGKAAS